MNVENLPDHERVKLIGAVEDLNEMEGEPDFLKYADDAPGLIEAAKEREGHPIGFESLDAITEGVSSGELIVITATTGVGKSTFAQSITRNLANEEVPSLWYTLEMPVPQFLKPLINHDPNVEYESGKIHKLSNYPIYFPKDVEKLSFNSLKHTIRTANLKYGVEHVFIDHLHYLLSAKEMARVRSTSMHIGNRVRDLGRIALETGVTIFLIVHTKKIPDGERPTLDSIRDSSFIGQEASVVLALWRERLAAPITKKIGDIEYEEQFSPITKVSVEKARRTGRKGITYLRYNDGLYEEITGSEAKFIEREAEAIAKDNKQYNKKT